MTGPFIICVGNVVRDEVFHVEELPSAGLKTDVLHYEERFGVRRRQQRLQSRISVGELLIRDELERTQLASPS